VPDALMWRCGGRGLRAAAPPVLVAAALLLLGLVAPPVDARADDAGRRTNLQVTLWRTGVPGQTEALSELVFSFQRSNPDVIVCLEWLDADLAGEWLRRWIGGYRSHAPDVTVASDLWVWDHRAELLRVPHDLRATLIDTLEPSVLERGGGLPRGAPWAVATPALYYRADLLAEAELEPPQTFAELADCARALAQPPERFGLGVPGPGAGGEELLYALALALAPPEGEDDADAIEQSRLQRALELLVGLQADGALQPEVLTWGESELVEAFAQGRLGMLIGRPWVAQMLRGRAQRPPVEWAVAPLPGEDGGSGTVQVDWLFAFGDTDRAENAQRFLRFMAEKESQRALAMLCGAPALRSLSEELAGAAPWSGHIPALRHGGGLPLGRWDDLRGRLGEALALALSGRMTPAEALRPPGEEAEAGLP